MEIFYIIHDDLYASFRSFVRLFVKFISDIFCIENCVWEMYEKEAEISTNTATLLFLCNMYIQQLRLLPSIHPKMCIESVQQTSQKKETPIIRKNNFYSQLLLHYFIVSVPVVRS